jgi:hypothetical protein
MGERELGIIYFLNKCAIKYNDENIKKMRFNTHDRGNENKNNKEYSMCYNSEISELEKYCGIDWVFYHWPSASINSFEQTKNEIILKSQQEPTIDKIGWYGNIYSPLPDVIEYKTRPLLKEISNQYPKLFDIINIMPNNWSINNSIPNYLSLPDLINYKYLIDIGGNGYSGRLKFLLFSKRPLLIVDRKYIEYFQNDLIPYIHYIPVKMDLSDLLEQVNWMKNNYEKSLEIAKNAFEFAVNNFTEDKLLDRVYYVYNNINKTL